MSSSDPLRILMIGRDPRWADTLERHEWSAHAPRAVIVQAGDAKSRQDLPSSSEFDVALVVLDVANDNGRHALEHIRMLDEAPVVALSSRYDPELERRATQCGAQDCLDLDELSARRLDTAIQHALERHRLRRELREAHAKLAHSNAFFADVLECTMAGYWDWNIREGTEYLSPGFKAMLGYAEHEMENRPGAWQAIVHPEDLPGVLEAYTQHVASRGEVPFEREVRHIHKDGHLVWVWCKGKVIEWDDDDKPVRMVGSHIDITSMKQMQDMLARSNAELEQYAYVASHDLQEPVRIISNYVEILRHEHGDALGPEADRYLDFVVSATSRMQQLIRGILALSRVECQGKELRLIQAEAALRDAMANLEASVGESGAGIIYNDLPAIRADQTQLAQVFQNLISNALKFRASEPPRIEITAEQRDNMWVFCVKDNGIGFEPKTSQRIFKIFNRLHRREDYPGSGIGLAIVKKVAEKHGGRAWAHSDGKTGSSFYFSLPAHRAEENRAISQ